MNQKPLDDEYGKMTEDGFEEDVKFN